MRSIYLFTGLMFAACHGHSHSDYATFSACYDEHTMEENLPTREAIVVCCLDHDIGGAKEVCGADHVACEAYLRTNLTSVSSTEVTAACADYETQKGM